MDKQKRKLREQAAERRSAITADIRKSGALAVASTGSALSDLASGGIVAGYFPVRHEFNDLPLIEVLAGNGIPCCLPLVENVAGPLTFKRWQPGDPMQSGRFNIDIPLDRAPIVTPATLLVPMLAFDRHGTRLGYGGGHYDRTLMKLRVAGNVTAIGLAFDEQEFTELPVEPHDQPLDYILTPAGLRRFGE